MPGMSLPSLSHSTCGEGSGSAAVLECVANARYVTSFLVSFYVSQSFIILFYSQLTFANHFAIYDDIFVVKSLLEFEITSKQLSR